MKIHLSKTIIKRFKILGLNFFNSANYKNNEVHKFIFCLVYVCRLRK